MASTIQLKRGSGAPTSGDLAVGEPAFDLTNKRLYTEDTGGSVIEVGTNPSSLTTTSLTTTNSVAGDYTGVRVVNSSADLSATSEIKIESQGGTWDLANVRNGGHLQFVLNGSDYMRLGANGKVGLGTINPQSDLHIESATPTFQILETDSGESNRLIVGVDTDGVYYNATFGVGGTPAHRFESANIERVRITNTGNVGIGTTSPARSLHVNDVMRLEPRATAPSSPSAGDIFFNSSTNKLQCYDGSTWQNCF